MRSIDNNCGAYNFTSSIDFPKTNFPVKPGDFAEIFINDQRMSAGYIDTIKVREIDERHFITCEGRDAIQDIVDSSVPDSAKTNKEVSLKTLCQLVVDSLGSEVKVLDWLEDLIEPFSAIEFLNTESTENCMQYLVSFARKRQAYLIPVVTNRDIYLVIFRPFLGDKVSGSLIHKLNDPRNNVLEYTLFLSYADRYNSYICRSQSNIAIVPIIQTNGIR